MSSTGLLRDDLYKVMYIALMFKTSAILFYTTPCPEVYRLACYLQLISDPPHPPLCICGCMKNRCDNTFGFFWTKNERSSSLPKWKVNIHLLLYFINKIMKLSQIMFTTFNFMNRLYYIYAFLLKL